MDDCLFCKIAAGQIPSNKLYEDDQLLAFYDIDPQAPTHFLVIPKRHIDSAAALTESDIDTFLSGAKIGDIYLTQLENPVDVVGYGLRQAKLRGLFTILNPAPADAAIAAYFPWVDLIVPNETELSLLGGREALAAAGIRRIVTTLGARGYEIADEDGVRTYPCISVNAVDTTAAGDTLCGGLAVGLAEGMSLADACAFGSRAASIACTRLGAQPSIPTRAETENRRA